MGTLNSSGQVILNADGKQYAASYQFQRGVFTVTSGSASRVVRVGAVAAPESLARTILKAMVRENGQRAELSETPASRCTRAGIESKQTFWSQMGLNRRF
jgi:monoamine oxidase